MPNVSPRRKVARDNREVADFIAAGLPVVNSGRSMTVSKADSRVRNAIYSASWLNSEDKETFLQFLDTCDKENSLVCWSYKTPIVAVDMTTKKVWRATQRFSQTTSRHTGIFQYGISRLLANLTK